MKIMAQVGACLSSAFCLLGGVWILAKVGFSTKDDVMSTGIGLYFIGKAFFVGPMLWLAAGKCGRPAEAK
jgi:hypothetical protein